MDQITKETLETILAKDKDALSEEERQFLMARRSYLNDEQRERYADMIEAHEAGIGEEEVPLEEMNLKQLKAEAKKRGVDIKGLKTEEEILEAIQSAE